MIGNGCYLKVKLSRMTELYGLHAWLSLHLFAKGRLLRLTYTIHKFTVRYILSLQKAFLAVQQLWGQKFPIEYGPHMAESLLAILYHIIKGEAVIKEKLGPALETSSASTSAVASSATTRQPAEPARPQPEINVRHLQQVCSHSLSWFSDTWFLTLFLNCETEKKRVKPFFSSLYWIRAHHPLVTILPFQPLHLSMFNNHTKQSHH